MFVLGSTLYSLFLEFRADICIQLVEEVRGRSSRSDTGCLDNETVYTQPVYCSVPESQDVTGSLDAHLKSTHYTKYLTTIILFPIKLKGLLMKNYIVLEIRLGKNIFSFSAKM